MALPELDGRKIEMAREAFAMAQLSDDDVSGVRSVKFPGLRDGPMCAAGTYPRLDRAGWTCSNCPSGKTSTAGSASSADCHTDYASVLVAALGIVVVTACRYSRWVPAVAVACDAEAKDRVQTLWPSGRFC